MHFGSAVHAAFERVGWIDYKTDAAGSLEERVARDDGQMQSYREVMQRTFPGAPVDCVLLSTYLKSLVSLAAASARQPP